MQGGCFGDRTAGGQDPQGGEDCEGHLGAGVHVQGSYDQDGDDGACKIGERVEA